MSAHLDIRPLVEREDLTVWQHVGTGDRLVLCFSGIGAKKEPVPLPEFPMAATAFGRNHVLFIAEPQRTWLNAPGLLERIRDLALATQKDLGTRDMVALGHSMGGYSALVAAGVLPIRSVLALSPQYSVHPEVVGDDRRWWRHRKDIRMHQRKSALDQISQATAYHVIHGGDISERVQRDRFPVVENLNHVILPDDAHQFPRRLKRLSLLSGVVAAGLDDDATTMMKILEPLGAHARRMDEYPMLDAVAEKTAAAAG